MNPAVTLATLLNGRVTVLRALCYWGGLLGLDWAGLRH